jgi:hypothetical protein
LGYSYTRMINKEVNDITKIKQDTVNIQTYVDKFTIVRDILDELYEPVTCNQRDSKLMNL